MTWWIIPFHLTYSYFTLLSSLQIHDELLFEVGASETDVNRLKSVVLRCADECKEEFRLHVPLALKCNAGTSWATMEEM